MRLNKHWALLKRRQDGNALKHFYVYFKNQIKKNIYMLVYTDKCTILHIEKNNPHIVYNINKPDILTINEEKTCVWLSMKTSNGKLTLQVAKKTNSLIYVTNKVFSYKTVEFIKKIYVTFIRPKLEYCYMIWNPYFIKDIELIEKVQKRCTKIPAEARNLPYEERLRLLKLTTLKERRDRGGLIQTFKIINFPTTRTRGHSKKLQTEKCAILQRKHFFANRVVNAWNMLWFAENKNIFKNRLDKHQK